MLNKQVIVRADKAGVFFGTLKEKNTIGNSIEVVMTDVRKLFYWDGASAVEQIAMEGVKKPNNCKFTVVVDSMIIQNVIQIISCTNMAIVSINAVPIWKQ